MTTTFITTLLKIHVFLNYQFPPQFISPLFAAMCIIFGNNMQDFAAGLNVYTFLHSSATLTTSDNSSPMPLFVSSDSAHWLSLRSIEKIKLNWVLQYCASSSVCLDLYVSVCCVCLLTVWRRHDWTTARSLPTGLLSDPCWSSARCGVWTYPLSSEPHLSPWSWRRF